MQNPRFSIVVVFIPLVCCKEASLIGQSMFREACVLHLKQAYIFHSIFNTDYYQRTYKNKIRKRYWCSNSSNGLGRLTV